MAKYKGRKRHQKNKSKLVKISIESTLERMKEADLGAKITETFIYPEAPGAPFFNGPRLNVIGIQVYHHVIAQGLATIMKMGEEDGILSAEDRLENLRQFSLRVIKAMELSGSTSQREVGDMNMN